MGGEDTKENTENMCTRENTENTCTGENTETGENTYTGENVSYGRKCASGRGPYGPGPSGGYSPLFPLDHTQWYPRPRGPFLFFSPGPVRFPAPWRKRTGRRPTGTDVRPRQHSTTEYAGFLIWFLFFQWLERDQAIDPERPPALGFHVVDREHAGVRGPGAAGAGGRWQFAVLERGEHRADGPVLFDKADFADRGLEGGDHRGAVRQCGHGV